MFWGCIIFAKQLVVQSYCRRPDAGCCAAFLEYAETMGCAINRNKKQQEIADALAMAVFVIGDDGVGMIEMIVLLPYLDAKRRRWAQSAETQLGALVITGDREIIRTSGFGGYEMVEE